jgi:hypothetical protein
MFWCLIASVGLLVLALAGPGAVVGGPSGSDSRHVGPAASAWFGSIGAPIPLHDVLALPGPTAVTTVGTLHVIRSRPRSVAEPGAQGVGVLGQRPRAGPRVVAPRPPHLAVRGLFAVRAPPRAAHA